MWASEGNRVARQVHVVPVATKDICLRIAKASHELSLRVTLDHKVDGRARFEWRRLPAPYIRLQERQ